MRWQTSCPALFSLLLLSSTTHAQTSATAAAAVINNYVSGCYADYASINNAWQYAPPSLDGCQQFPAQIPAGWELVPPDDTDALMVIRRFSFGTQALVLSDGTAYATNVADNSKPVAVNIMSKGADGVKVTKCTPAAGILIRRQFGITKPATDFDLPMKTLLLAANSDISSLPQWVYNAYGAPVEFVDLSQHTTGYPLQLETSPGVPKYNAIVLTDANLVVNVAGKGWVSALTPDQWAAMRAYRAKYGVRMVVLASVPEADIALSHVGNSTTGTSAAATVRWIDSDHSRSLNDSVPLTAVFNFKEKVSFWYPAVADSAASDRLKPFLTINGNSNVGAYTRDCARWKSGEGKLEEMHFLFAMNIYTNSSFALADVWFTWVNKGLYLGQRRILLDPQVDDVLIESPLYDVKSNRQASDANSIFANSDNAYRINRTDFRALVDYQNRLNSRLPPGSNIMIQMAFNGAGWSQLADRPENLNDVVEELRDNFYWMSHTYSHLDLYCPDENCALNGFTKYNESYIDLIANKEFARTTLFTRRRTPSGAWVNVTDAEFNAIPNYSPTAMVTPGISGLNLSDSIQAMWDAGIRTAVGDNSRMDLKPVNPFHPFVTSTTGTRGAKIVVVPRFATRVYYDCSLPEENAMEYNSFYGPHCIGWNVTGTVSVNGALKCNATSIKADHDLTWEEIMEIEGQEVAARLLAKRTDPYMFHQANLRHFAHPSTPGGQTSLLGMWLDSVVDHFMQYSVLPIRNMRFEDLRKFYDARAARDNCQISGRVAYRSGQPTSVVVGALGTCEIKLTRSTGVRVTVSAVGKRREQDSETYGPDETFSIQVGPGVTRNLTLAPCQSACHVGAAGTQVPTARPAPTNATLPTAISTQSDIPSTNENSSGSVPIWAIAVAVAVGFLVIVAIGVGVCVCKRKKANKTAADVPNGKAVAA